MKTKFLLILLLFCFIVVDTGYSLSAKKNGSVKQANLTVPQTPFTVNGALGNAFDLAQKRNKIQNILRANLSSTLQYFSEKASSKKKLLSPLLAVVVTIGVIYFLAPYVSQIPILDIIKAVAYLFISIIGVTVLLILVMQKKKNRTFSAFSPSVWKLSFFFLLFSFSLNAQRDVIASELNKDLDALIQNVFLAKPEFSFVGNGSPIHPTGFPRTAYQVGHPEKFNYVKLEEVGMQLEMLMAASIREVQPSWATTDWQTEDYLLQLIKILNYVESLQEDPQAFQNGVFRSFYTFQNLQPNPDTSNPIFGSDSNAFFWKSMLLIKLWVNSLESSVNNDLKQTILSKIDHISNQMNFRIFLTTAPNTSLGISHFIRSGESSPLPIDGFWDIFGDEGGGLLPFFFI